MANGNQPPSAFNIRNYDFIINSHEITVQTLMREVFNEENDFLTWYQRTVKAEEHFSFAETVVRGSTDPAFMSGINLRALNQAQFILSPSQKESISAIFNTICMDLYGAMYQTARPSRNPHAGQYLNAGQNILKKE